MTTKFVSHLIKAAIKDYCNQHDDLEITGQQMSSIAKRAGRQIYIEARRRGLPKPSEQHFDDEVNLNRPKKYRDPPVREIEDFTLIGFSVVDTCPYCGMKFDEKGLNMKGEDCDHPTRFAIQGREKQAGPKSQ